jgi:hypothetical protein
VLLWNSTERPTLAYAAQKIRIVSEYTRYFPE